MFPALNRGFAVLPMLVFVALLGIVAIGVENLAPETNSQSQTASSFTEEVAAQQAALEKKTPEQICTEKKKEAMANSLAVKFPISNPETQGFKSGENATLKSKCIGAVRDVSKIELAETDLNKYKCVGLKVQVNINPDGGGVISSPNIGLFLPAGKCEVRFCEAPAAADQKATNCTVAVELQGSEGIQKWANEPTMKASLESTLSSQDAEEAPPLMAMDKTQEPDLADTSALQAQVEQQTKITEAARAEFDGCKLAPECNSSGFATQMLQEEAKLAALKENLADLETRQVVLSGNPELTRASTEVSAFGTGGPGTFNVNDNTFNTPPVQATLSSGLGPYITSKLEAASNAVKSTLTSVKETWSGFWSPVPTKGITDQIPSDPNAADTNTPVVTYPGPGGGTIANNTSEPVFPSTFEPFFEPAASQQPTLDAAAGTGGPGTFKVSDNTSNSPTVEQTIPVDPRLKIPVPDNTVSVLSTVRQVNPGFVSPPVSGKNTAVPVVASVQAPPIVSGVAEGRIAPIEGAGGSAVVNPWKGTIARQENPGFVSPGASSYFEDITTTPSLSIVGTGGPGTFKVSDNTSNSPTVAQAAPSMEVSTFGTGGPGTFDVSGNKVTVVPVVTSAKAPPIVSGVAEGRIAPIEGIKAPAVLAPLPPPVSTQIVTVASRVPLATACSGSSLANCLSSNNLPSDFYARKTLADSLGIDNYTGTSDQNIALLDDLVTNGYIAPQFFPPTALYKAASSYEGDSVVDFLSAAGQPSSFSERAALARKYGITGYKGTIKQNQQLLAALRATIRQ